MIEIGSPFARLAVASRALGLLGLLGAAVGLAIGMLGVRGSLDPFLSANQVNAPARVFMLACMFGGAGVAIAAGTWLLLWRGAMQARAAARLHEIARRLAPLALAPFPLLLFRHKVWASKPLPFLTMVGLFAAVAWATTQAAIGAPPLGWARLAMWASRASRASQATWPSSAKRTGLSEQPVRGALGRPGWNVRARALLPLALVMIAVVVYVTFSSIQTLGLHRAVRSGIELADANHLVWKLLHGGSFLESARASGAARAPGGPHAELVAYALAPFYALSQRAETLLLLQSLLIGGAALPLFFLGRRHLGPVAGAAVAIAYLMHPAVHAQQMSGFHFLGLGPMFFWSAWALLEHDQAAAAAPG